MKEFTIEEVREAFDKLPQELQEAISSTDVHDEVKDIGRKHGLMIDQIGELVDQIGLIMLGLAKSSNFVKDASRRLSINEQKAHELADDINKEIFGKIRSSMQAVEKQAVENGLEKSSSISSIERAGGFEIEKSAQQGEAPGDDAGAEKMTETDKINMLSDIENPEPGVSVNKLATLKTAKSVEPPANLPGVIMKPDEIKSEPLVDQLLSGPAARPEVKVDIKPISQAPKPPSQAPKSPPKSDPYREPIE